MLVEAFALVGGEHDLARPCAGNREELAHLVEIADRRRGDAHLVDVADLLARLRIDDIMHREAAMDAGAEGLDDLALFHDLGQVDAMRRAAVGDADDDSCETSTDGASGSRSRRYAAQCRSGLTAPRRR